MEINITKQTLARFAGWGQFVAVIANEALSTNGGNIPNTRDGWMKILSSAAIAIAAHLASATSDAHPNGTQKQAGFAKLPAMIFLSVALVTGLGCGAVGKYVIHPHSIAIGNDGGAFDSHTVDTLAEIHVALLEAEKHTADYPPAVSALFTKFNTDYGIAKTAYLTWRKLQTAAALTDASNALQQVQSSQGEFSVAVKAVPAPAAQKGK